jgi:hypothetical protein
VDEFRQFCQARGRFIFVHRSGDQHWYELVGPADPAQQAALRPRYAGANRLALVVNPFVANPFAAGQVPDEVLVEYLPMETREQEEALYASGVLPAQAHLYRRVPALTASVTTTEATE